MTRNPRHQQMRIWARLLRDAAPELPTITVGRYGKHEVLVCDGAGLVVIGDIPVLIHSGELRAVADPVGALLEQLPTHPHP